MMNLSLFLLACTFVSAELHRQIPKREESRTALREFRALEEYRRSWIELPSGQTPDTSVTNLRTEATPAPTPQAKHAEEDTALKGGVSVTLGSGNARVVYENGKLAVTPQNADDERRASVSRAMNLDANRAATNTEIASASRNGSPRVQLTYTMPGGGEQTQVLGKSGGGGC